MLIFHKKRRDIIAKAFIDIFKLTFIASCVSGFNVEYRFMWSN